MSSCLKKCASFVVTFCLLMSAALPTSAAVSASSVVKTAMEQTVEESGYMAVGEFTGIDAETKGAAVTVELPVSGADAARSVVVAVQPLDDKGAALDNHGVRYLLAEVQGNAAFVTIQEAGCRYFAVLPIQGGLEQGSITGLNTTSQLTDKGYEITVSAELTMSDDLATMAAMCQGSQTMKNMRMTCRVESPLLLGMTSVDMERVTFHDHVGIYSFVRADIVNGGVEIVYRVSDAAIANWSTMELKEIREELQTTVSMSCTQTVSPAVIQQGANQEGKLYTYGQVSITNGDGSKEIPGMGIKRIVVPSQLAEVSAAKLQGISDVLLFAERNGSGTVSVTINNQETTALGGCLLCVVYDRDGKMLGYTGSYVAVNGEDIGKAEIALPAVSGTIHKAKVMLLDVANGCAPVCEAVELR